MQTSKGLPRKKRESTGGKGELRWWDADSNKVYKATKLQIQNETGNPDIEDSEIFKMFLARYHGKPFSELLSDVDAKDSSS